MKYYIPVFSLLILFTSCVKVYNQNPHESGRLAISSSAELMVVPDEMSISFGIEKYDTSVKRARTHTRNVLDSLVELLKKEGISEKNIEYGRISITPRYPKNQYGKRIIGYTTSLDVTVKLQNFDLISAVVDMAVNSGVNTIGNFNFYSTKMPENKKRVRSMAIKAAMEKAQQYEKEMNLTLGKLISVEENPNSIADSRGVMNMVVQRKQTMESEAGPGISPGEIPLRLFITCEYEILK
ncbi:MAG: SIMPL domain-containing protein [Spirochaetes bacterium]|jgi:uncharacterized protein YggE|nr:SIMPL domain-containing protein [Spirochaetota bacterium]